MCDCVSVSECRLVLLCYDVGCNDIIVKCKAFVDPRKNSRWGILLTDQTEVLGDQLLSFQT